LLPTRDLPAAVLVADQRIERARLAFQLLGELRGRRLARDEDALPDEARIFQRRGLEQRRQAGEHGLLLMIRNDDLNENALFRLVAENSLHELEARQRVLAVALRDARLRCRLQMQALRVRDVDVRQLAENDVTFREVDVGRAGVARLPRRNRQEAGGRRELSIERA